MIEENSEEISKIETKYKNICIGKAFKVFGNIGRYVGLMTGVSGFVSDDFDPHKALIGGAIYLLSSGLNDTVDAVVDLKMFSELEKQLIKNGGRK